MNIIRNWLLHPSLACKVKLRELYDNSDFKDVRVVTALSKKPPSLRVDRLDSGSGRLIRSLSKSREVSESPPPSPKKKHSKATKKKIQP